MKSSYPACVSTMKQHEAGKKDDPNDPGGRTGIGGITQRTYDSWRRMRDLPERDVWQISMDEVHAIYREEFWNVIRGDVLPTGIDLCVLDHSLPSGPDRAIKMMQAEAGAIPDGRIGSNTVEKVRLADSGRFINEFTERRIKFYKGRSLYSTFGAGWLRRASETRRIAHALDGRTDELPELKNGSVGTFVGLAQDMLEIKADKHFGPDTKGAVIGFQTRLDLVADGVIGQKTWAMLFAEYKL